MDVFERVREVGAGTDLTADQVAGARSRLLSGIDADTAAARKRLGRRPMLLIVGAAAAAAVRRTRSSASPQPLLAIGDLTSSKPSAATP